MDVHFHFSLSNLHKSVERCLSGEECLCSGLVLNWSWHQKVPSQPPCLLSNRQRLCLHADRCWTAGSGKGPCSLSGFWRAPIMVHMTDCQWQC